MAHEWLYRSRPAAYALIPNRDYPLGKLAEIGRQLVLSESVALALHRLEQPYELTANATVSCTQSTLIACKFGKRKSRHADAKLREKRILLGSNETDRIAGEIYAPSIRFKRAGKEFWCRATFTSTKTSSRGGRLAGRRRDTYRIPTVLVRGAGPEGPVDLRKYSPSGCSAYAGCLFPRPPPPLSLERGRREATEAKAQRPPQERGHYNTNFWKFPMISVNNGFWLVSKNGFNSLRRKEDIVHPNRWTENESQEARFADTRVIECTYKYFPSNSNSNSSIQYSCLSLPGPRNVAVIKRTNLALLGKLCPERLEVRSGSWASLLPAPLGAASRAGPVFFLRLSFASSFARRFHLSHRVSYFVRIERQKERERKGSTRPQEESIGLADRLVGGRQPAAKHKRSLPSTKDNRALPSSSLLRVSSMPQPDGCNFGQCISPRLIQNLMDAMYDRLAPAWQAYSALLATRRKIRFDASGRAPRERKYRGNGSRIFTPKHRIRESDLASPSSSTILGTEAVYGRKRRRGAASNLSSNRRPWTNH
ncbi:hypothetical protein EAG_12742 [Camponotus floridanus]|uniref:Uncharacterized protein n=1 Tax=Camponotus floridanus TaxID=104421 RepID=E2AZE4_CAMFO|nr:hypothetical protein EAG_12742 [Camponotus floridanus]